LPRVQVDLDLRRIADLDQLIPLQAADPQPPARTRLLRGQC
jgi:hypothetical protein